MGECRCYYQCCCDPAEVTVTANDLEAALDLLGDEFPRIEDHPVLHRLRTALSASSAPPRPEENP